MFCTIKTVCIVENGGGGSKHEAEGQYVTVVQVRDNHGLWWSWSNTCSDQLELATLSTLLRKSMNFGKNTQFD